jgi:predicted transcriptional regulator
MLNRVENKVMATIFSACNNKTSLLITPIDLIKMTGEKSVSLSTMERIVKDLHSDGYFDLIYSDRHGETVYCISLTEKGKGFIRNKKVLRRNLIYRVSLTVALAFLSFIIGIILKAIF